MIEYFFKTALYKKTRGGVATFFLLFTFDREWVKSFSLDPKIAHTIFWLNLNRNHICAVLAVLSNEEVVRNELLFPYSLFSQNIHYNTTFYASPVVLVSVHHYYNRNMKNVILPENNIVTAWVEVRYFSTDFLKIILWFSKRWSISSQRVSFFSRELA